MGLLDRLNEEKKKNGNISSSGKKESTPLHKREEKKNNENTLPPIMNDPFADLKDELKNLLIEGMDQDLLNEEDEENIIEVIK